MNDEHPSNEHQNADGDVPGDRERHAPEAFHALCAEFGIVLEPAEIDRLTRYLALLLDTNAQFNLTSITDWEEAWTKHIFDSLTLLSVLTELQPAEVVDIGSGGGLPGIPLAIAKPDVNFTLLEATGKKARFLAQAAEACNLQNVFIVNGRAEEAAALGEPLRDRFDVVLARAVGRLNVLLELTVPFARIGGIVIAVKGGQADVEVEEARPALHKLHAAHLETITTPTGRLVIIEKRRTTPKVYPRRPGEPKKHPL